MDDLIIAKIQWFCDKCRYYKDFGNKDIDEVKDYILREKMDVKTIEDLWYCLLANYRYKTAPSIGVINAVYEEHVKQSQKFRTSNDKYGDLIRHNAKVVKSYRDLSLKEILYVIKVIRAKDIEEWSFTDKQFWNEHDVLWWEFKACKDKGMNPQDMQEHLEYVLRQTRIGEYFRPINDLTVTVSDERKGMQSFNDAISIGQ